MSFHACLVCTFFLLPHKYLTLKKKKKETEVWEDSAFPSLLSKCFLYLRIKGMFSLKNIFFVRDYDEKRLTQVSLDILKIIYNYET